MKILIGAAALLLIVFGLGAEGQREQAGGAWAWRGAVGTDDPLLPEVDATQVRGNLIAAGSSTVYPLTAALVERFRQEGYSGNITVDAIGTGAGFERFAKGESDLANASARISPAQRRLAEGGNRRPLEFQVGLDPLVIAVSKTNTFARDITTAEVVRLFSEAVYWSDVRAGWPRERIRRFSPGTDSGTFDYFVEHFFNRDRSRLLLSEGTQFSEDDNVLVRGVEGSPFAVGYFGYAYYEEEQSKMRALAVDGVVPGAESVAAGTYPLSRPLFVYTDPQILRSKPQAAAFLAFYLTWVNEEIRRVGYFPAPASALEASKRLWLETLNPASRN